MVFSNEIQSNKEYALCSTIKKAKNEVDKILKNRLRIIEDVTKLRSTPICTIKTPNGQENLSVNDLEKKYTLNYPSWNKFCQSLIFHSRHAKECRERKKAFTKACHNDFQTSSKHISSCSEIV